MSKGSGQADTAEPADAESEAIHRLIASGFTTRGGVLSPPGNSVHITQDQWDAIHYLCDEWDYDFETTEQEREHI